MAESNREEIAKLEALYANNPGGRVFTHLAEAYRKAGELDRARAILESGITRHPDYASAHVVLGRVLIDQGALETAAMEFRRVLELDPENRVALRSLGDIARNSDPENALDHYRHLHSLDPADEDLANTIANLESQLTATAFVESTQEPGPPEFQIAAPTPDEIPQPPVEPVRAAFAEPVSEPETQPYEPPIQPSEADFGAGWEPDSEEEALPGDLAHLARLDASDHEPTQSEPPADQTAFADTRGTPEPPFLTSETESGTGVVEEPAPDVSSDAQPITEETLADEPWAATAEPAAIDEPWLAEPVETEEPWAQPAPTENTEPWATAEPAEIVDPWATAEPTETTDPWATTESDAPEPWAPTLEPDLPEPWAAATEPDAPEPWAATTESDAPEPWAAPPVPAELDEPWAAPADGMALDEPPAKLPEPPDEQSVEATLEVVGFISARIDGDDVEPTEALSDGGVDDRSAPLPEFSGFAEAADAILRPEGEAGPEATEPSETAEPSFEEMLSANLGAESPLVREESEDLPTETLAELYRTQGFFGRAADVYRALLAESPEDARLRGLLREVEEHEHSPMEAGGERIIELDAVVAADDELSARVAASAEDSGPPEAWLEGVESAWTGGSGAADLDDAHYPWSHDASEESVGGVTLQDYLKTLLAWRPTESAPSLLVDELEQAETEDEVSESFAYTVPGDTARTEISSPPAQPEPVSSESEPPISALADHPSPDPWEETPITQAPVAASPSSPAEPPRVEFARPAASTSTPRSTGNAVDDAFEEWFGGGTPSSPAQPVAPVAHAVGNAPAAPAPAPTPVADLDDEADDDLEVFRSWLQSLKR